MADKTGSAGIRIAISGQKSQPESTDNAPPGSTPRARKGIIEMRTMTLLKITMFAVLFAVMLPATASLAQTEIPINYTWTAPTTGTAVDHYLVEHSINGGQWTVAGTTTENSFTLNATTGQSHQIRVAGVDSADRQGIFSVASDSYTPDEGAPGKPGKPILF